MTKNIINWNELTEEEKIKAKEILNSLKLNNSSESSELNNKEKSSSDFFEENSYLVIKNFIDKNMCGLLYHHVLSSAKRLNYIDELYGSGNYDKGIYGTFDDKQADGDYSKYGDPIFDALLELSTDQISFLTGKDLIPTYSYHRLYTTDTELKKHIDRPSCEISTTLCLGYDIKNLKTDYSWPMFVKTKDNNEIPLHLETGDMIIYKGCEIEHWREPFKGNNHAQVFLHYNQKNGKFNIENDGRPFLGLPSSFKM